MMLSDAVKQVGADENIEAAFLRLYGSQVQPENFRKLFNAVRKCPAEMIETIQQHADKSPDDAFRAIHPDYVNVGEFMAAVLDARKAAPEQSVAEVETTQDVETENAEG
jgi:hypothetical protein